MFSMVSKHREVILYSIFGGLTTVVNWAIYGFGLRVGMNYSWANALAFVAAIIFAYVTNKKYVFESHTKGASKHLQEMMRFLASRLGTFFMEWLGLFLMIDWLGLTPMLPKVLMTGIVIVLNYVLSKSLVFVKQL